MERNTRKLQQKEGNHQPREGGERLSESNFRCQKGAERERRGWKEIQESCSRENKWKSSQPHFNCYSAQCQNQATARAEKETRIWRGSEGKRYHSRGVSQKEGTV